MKKNGEGDHLFREYALIFSSRALAQTELGSSHDSDDPTANTLHARLCSTVLPHQLKTSAGLLVRISSPFDFANECEKTTNIKKNQAPKIHGA